MIGSLRGTVLERTGAGEVLLEVAGVGYRVLVPLRGLGEYRPGASAFAYVHHHVREDASALYGFSTRDERDVFESLIGATGVGPKLGLAILSAFGPDELRRILLDDDADALVAVPGVGKKTAQRLLLELKSRLAVPDLDLVRADTGVAPAADGASRVGAVRAEVRAALEGLGYSSAEARELLARVGELPDGSAATLLREALRLAAGARP